MAEDKVEAIAREGSVFAGGLAGGYAGGAAGLACGPGAIVCVPLGVFLGGVLGSWGGEVAFSYFWH